MVVCYAPTWITRGFSQTFVNVVVTLVIDELIRGIAGRTLFYTILVWVRVCWYRRSSRLLLRLASMASLDNQLFVCWLRRLVTHVRCANWFRTAMTSSRSWTAYIRLLLPWHTAEYYLLTSKLSGANIVVFVIKELNWRRTSDAHIKYTACITECSETPRSWTRGVDLIIDELSGVINK